MPRERKKIQNLLFDDYQIDGNVFRAWHDDAGRLVFVLDETIDDYKPYALLIIDSYGKRKWDDVLVNDFNVNIDDIRPRKENKYQKLDIEYGGLGCYARLIDAYNSGNDISDALFNLYDFRDAAVRRAATERLVAAMDVIEQSAKTTKLAERSIESLQNRRHVLERRLERQREFVGREPTKQSASRILKTESQIEKNAEKLVRAQRRIENANRRADAARDDAAVLRDVIARRRPGHDVMSGAVEQKRNMSDVLTPGHVADTFDVPVSKQPKKLTPESMPIRKIAATKLEPVPDDEPEHIEEFKIPVPDYEITQEPEETKMPEKKDEVKPLLDQDPEILDEEIAFKPVAFDDIKPRVDTKPADNKSADDVASVEVIENKPERHDDDSWGDFESVFDREKLGTDSQTSEQYPDVQHNTESENMPEPAESSAEKPVLNTIKSVDEPTGADVDTTGQTSNTQYADANPSPRPASPNVVPAAGRPISPITGTNVKVRPVGGRQKPTLVYYLLLIVLIALSVFTLWLYQKKNGGTVPFLNQTGETEARPDVIAGADSFINVEPEPEPVAPVSVTPEPVVVEPDVPINVEYPNKDILYAAEPDVPVVESEESVLSRKEPYQVSREMQPVYVPAPEPERVTNVTSPDVIFDEDVVSVPVIAPEYVDEEEEFYNENGQDAVYYTGPTEYYEPQEYNEYDDYDAYGVYDEYFDDGEIVEDGGFVMDAGDDMGDRRYLSVHDGGQYSVGYTETTR